MSFIELHLPELAQRLEFPHHREELSVAAGVAAVVVDLVGLSRVSIDPAVFTQRVQTLTTVVIARRSEPHDVSTEPYAAGCDLIVQAERPEALDDILDAISGAPLAATTAALLLRHSEARSITEGLIAESMAYSTLQSGPEFLEWRERRGHRVRPAEIGPAVLVERDDATLNIVLARPHVHNAFSARLRDGLIDAFALAVADPTITQVRLSGSGPSFCSGGDLDEFGSFANPAEAHVVRLTRSPARLAEQLRERLVVHLHGAAMGAGIELPAFAGRIIADHETKIALPELNLGLVPGAGGTVSLPRRIGRQRTAWLALTGQVLDAPTALAWGLIDEISPRADL